MIKNNAYNIYDNFKMYRGNPKQSTVWYPEESYSLRADLHQNNASGGSRCYTGGAYRDVGQIVERQAPRVVSGLAKTLLWSVLSAMSDTDRKRAIKKAESDFRRAVLDVDIRDQGRKYLNALESDIVRRRRSHTSLFNVPFNEYKEGEDYIGLP